MADLRKECSLYDCKELKQMIVENPELPLLIFCGDEAYHGEFAYEANPLNAKPCIKELALYESSIYDGLEWVDREEYEDRLRDDMSDWQELENLSDEEFDKQVADRLSKVDFIKAIVIYVG